MYEYNKVINAIAKFVDDDILTNVNGWQKWLLGSGVGLMLSDSEEMFNQIKDNDFVKMLKIVDNDKINVDKIYKELKKQAKKQMLPKQTQKRKQHSKPFQKAAKIKSWLKKSKRL